MSGVFQLQRRHVRRGWEGILIGTREECERRLKSPLEHGALRLVDPFGKVVLGRSRAAWRGIFPVSTVLYTPPKAKREVPRKIHLIVDKGSGNCGALCGRAGRDGTVYTGDEGKVTCGACCRALSRKEKGK